MLDPSAIDVGAADPDVPLTWRDLALCAQTDPEVFFPEKGGTTTDAKALCWTCPVQGDCLLDAVERGERYGVWGGLSERERRPLIAGTQALPAWAVPFDAPTGDLDRDDLDPAPDGDADLLGLAAVVVDLTGRADVA